MEVLIVQKPHDPINTIYVACRTCYSDMKISAILAEAATMTDEDKLKLVKAVMNSGHMSTVEHVSFTFAIDGMSRVITQQLTRHRLAAYSQQSQRYVRMKEIIDEMVENAPRIINNNEETLAQYRAKLVEAFNSYNYMVEELIKEGYNNEEACENARLLLPNATPSNILVTMNLREIIYVCNLRTCTRAQAEIREAFSTLARLISADFPFTKQYLVPKCLKDGYCTEHKSCGIRPKKKNVLECHANWAMIQKEYPDATIDDVMNILKEHME